MFRQLYQPRLGCVWVERTSLAAGRVASALRLAMLGVIAPAAGHAADIEDFLTHDFLGATFQPQLDVAEAYTDNVTYAQGVGKIADLQSTFSPGVRILGGDPQGNRAAVELTHDETLYFDHSGFNYRQNHFKGNAVYSTSRLTFEPTESYEQLSGFLGGVIGQSGVINLAPRQRDVWSGTLRTTYAWTDRTQIYVDFSHYLTDWAKDVALYDYTNLRGALGGRYEATDRIQFFSEAFYGQTGITANQLFQTPGVASATYGAFIGSSGQFTSRFSGTAKVGMENRDFFETGRTGVLIPAFDLDLRYQFSEVTYLKLQYSRRTSPSLNLGGQNVTSDSVSLTASHLLDEVGVWEVRGSLTYQLSDYSNTALPGLSSTARKDDFTSADLGVYFHPRPWLTASVGYAFEYYHVNFANPSLALRSQTGYQANRVFLNLSLGF